MSLFFAYPGYEEFTEQLAQQVNSSLGKLEFHTFPDTENLIRIKSDVKSQQVVLCCSLDQADKKILPLLFFAETARELGATSVVLVAPYLGYMRQDKRFQPGEAITAQVFAKTLSAAFDRLVTMDPHLHRFKNLSEIYSIETTLTHADEAIASWIRSNVQEPLLIGPDEESNQWVEEVANLAQVPFTVLTKKRMGDKHVEVSVPEVSEYLNHQPILVDDIISTARTMIETVAHLVRLGVKPPICIGVHGVFADDGYEKLQNSHVSRIVTCNTIQHETNAIDIVPILARSLT